MSLLWLRARPPASPHLLPIRPLPSPHKHRPLIKTAGLQPSTPGRHFKTRPSAIPLLIIGQRPKACSLHSGETDITVRLRSERTTSQANIGVIVPSTGVPHVQLAMRSRRMSLGLSLVSRGGHHQRSGFWKTQSFPKRFPLRTAEVFG